ncbi:MAG TPA: recombinase family protein [Gaiellaceae bacterium]|jgi:hypothetical protein|nr:recombinase family protein [Gaiellaceae bacterium]
MSSRRHRRRIEKQRRQAIAPASTLSARDFYLMERVERLAYTRRQAAEALGVSLATLDRRVVPVIETVKTEWGARLIPADELKRYLAERRQAARVASRRPDTPGRKSGVESVLVARIRGEYAKGHSLGEIARGLNRDGVRTSQGGRQWWPSTVRAVLVRSRPSKPAC